MTGIHPAEVIRRAAAAMRQHVQAMEAEMPRYPYSWGSEADGTPDERYRRGVDDGLGGPAGVLASHWDLTTTRAVAGWLESGAEHAERPGALLLHSLSPGPLAVALGYLGEAGEQVKDISDEGERDVPDWTYTDGDGDKLTIEAGTRAILLRVASDDAVVAVGRADLPEVAARMYEAAGLPAPVILSRPEIDLQTGKGVNLFSVALGDGTVLVSQGSGHGCVPLAPGVARLLAAVIAAYADAAEASDPDPAEVEALAEKISAEMAHRGGGTGAVFRVAAEVALRHFKDEQRGGESNG